MEQQVLTAEQAYNQVLEQAETIKCGEEQRVETMSYGDAWRQGDIYIQCVKELRQGAEEIKDRQLAPGSTQGSRHIALGNVKVFKVGGGALQGPYIVADTRFKIAHPEHADVSLPPGIYSITYQRAHAEELKRVLD